MYYMGGTCTRRPVFPMLPITARQSWYSGELCLPGDVQIVDLGAMIGKDIHVAARCGDSRGYY